MALSDPAAIRAVFFDVDFTLIHPGPAFQGAGYQRSCARFGVTVDPADFDSAVAGAATTLHVRGDAYDPRIFIDYTRRIIEGMGGAGEGVEAAARDIYEQWSGCQHFHLYDDASAALRTLHASGLKIGIISNAQRCFETFQTHFDLRGLFAVTISSYDHGFMKPHPSIFERALREVGVEPRQALMVGDSVAHDIDGAVQLGMPAVLLLRAGEPSGVPEGVPVIRSLGELPPLLACASVS